MPRRAEISIRPLDPDPIYGSVLVTQVVNKVMSRGKKSVAERVFYDSMDMIETATKRPSIETFETALRNATPQIEVKPRRVGGATYQVPVEIRADRRTSLAMRWIIQAARKRPGKSMSERLAGELMDAMNNTGGAVRRKEETHKMAEANKAFSHYKW